MVHKHNLRTRQPKVQTTQATSSPSSNNAGERAGNSQIGEDQPNLRSETAWLDGQTTNTKKRRQKNAGQAQTLQNTDSEPKSLEQKVDTIVEYLEHYFAEIWKKSKVPL